MITDNVFAFVAMICVVAMVRAVCYIIALILFSNREQRRWPTRPQG